MSQIFDIVEELEKERKKSKILEENNKLLIQQKAQMYQDLDMLSNRIDKAIEYILNNTTYKSSTKEYGLKGNNKSQLLKISELLDILRGKII